ncbi:MAG: transposase [Thermoplasmatales archaeon]
MNEIENPKEYDSPHGNGPENSVSIKKEYGKLTDDIVAGKVEGTTIPVPSEIENLVEYTRRLVSSENFMAKKLDEFSQNHPLRKQYLSKVKGIGPIFSSGLIAYLHPISRFPTIGHLWAYAGLSAEYWKNECKKGHKFISTSARSTCPVKKKNGKPCNEPIVKSEKVQGIPKRATGYVLFINTNLKYLMTKIGMSFEKQSKSSRFRKLYEVKKAEYKAKFAQRGETEEKGLNGHARMAALRYVEKRFLSDLWVVWRQIEGLPVTKPYAFTVLGHTDEHYEPPSVDRGTLTIMEEKYTIKEEALRQIKLLLNNYYDLQVLRIKAWNNCNAYVKDNFDKILETIPKHLHDRYFSVKKTTEKEEETEEEN